MSKYKGAQSKFGLRGQKQKCEKNTTCRRLATHSASLPTPEGYSSLRFICVHHINEMISDGVHFKFKPLKEWSDWLKLQNVENFTGIRQEIGLFEDREIHEQLIEEGQVNE